MSRQANPAAVGGFVLGGLALAVAGILFFGGGSLFSDTARSVIYFEGSVNGLTVGSPVKLEGVEVGEVIHVRVIADLEPERIQALTETTIEIDRARFEQRGLGPSDSAERRQLLIEQGLRARLESQSFITGQLYVALVVLPDTEPRLVNLEGAPYPEIPAVPTTQQEIERTVRGVIDRFQGLPIEELVQKLDSVVSGVDQFVNDPELSGAVANLNATLAGTRGVVADARVLIRDVDGRIAPIADSAVAALEQAHQTLETLETSVEPGSALGYQLTVTLRELGEAARAVRVLADYLEREPNSVVFGRASVEQ